MLQLFSNLVSACLVRFCQVIANIKHCIPSICHVRCLVSNKSLSCCCSAAPSDHSNPEATKRTLLNGNQTCLCSRPHLPIEYCPHPINRTQRDGRPFLDTVVFKDHWKGLKRLPQMAVLGTSSSLFAMVLSKRNADMPTPLEMNRVECFRACSCPIRKNHASLS